jgi:methylglutaconyl-CoA hydratase
VGRVHGAALGGGMGLIAVCDIVIAAEGTVFGFTETKLGILPAVISRFVLPKMGESWARALYLTGERFGADVARRVGLVHWVSQDDALDALVDEKVRALLGGGPLAVREAKSLVLTARGLDTFAMRELTAERIAAVRTTVEGQEGLRAFLEKRKPDWLADGTGD